MMGVYQVAFSVFVVTIAAVTSGIPLFVSTHTAKPNIIGTRDEHRILTSGLVINLMLAVICIAGILIFRPVFLKIFADDFSHRILLLLLPAIAFTAAAEVYKSNMWGHKKYTLVSVLELSEQIIRIILCLILLFLVSTSSSKASLAAMSLSIVSGIGLIMVVIAYHRQGGRYTYFDRSDASALSKVATPVTVLRLIGSCVSLAMAIILPLRLINAGYSEKEAMTAYGASVGMSLGFIYTPLTLTGALATALIPEMSVAAASGNIAAVRRRAEKAIIFAVISAAAFIPVFGIIGSDIGLFVYKNSASGSFLAKATIIMIPLAVDQITSSILNAVGKERRGFVNSMSGTALLIAAICFLPRFIGIDALVVGMFCSMTLSASLNIYCLRRHYGISLKFLRPLALNLIFLIPACSLVWGLDRLLYAIPPVLNIIICAGAGIGSMALFNICFSIIDISSFRVIARSHAAAPPNT